MCDMSILKCSLGVKGPTIKDPSTKCDCNLSSEFNQLAQALVTCVEKLETMFAWVEDQQQ